ncbi:MAG TPA: amino acid adenylation domain-containing protein, partial [Thermoanaerobaculia bacterium]
MMAAPHHRRRERRQPLPSLVGGVSNLVALARARAEAQPERPGYLFLTRGEVEADRLSYAELDTRARALGAELQRRGASGERALLLYPPGLDFLCGFLGCPYARVIAVPAYPPRPGRDQPALRSILRDARPRLVLTTPAMLARLPALAAELPELRQAEWLASSDVADELAAAWRTPGIDGSTLAFLQYTSGSTSSPRGVKVSHANLWNNQEVIRRAFRQSERSVVVSWLPPYHDMGLIGGLLQPLYAGARCILMSPLAFLERPLRWLETVSRYRATTSGGPNFAYELCVTRAAGQPLPELDLSSWEVAFNGAEPVRADTLARFAETFGGQGFSARAFHPCYGLAEATLFVTGGSRAAGPAVAKLDAAALAAGRVARPLRRGAAAPSVRSLVGCGRPSPDHQVVIADPRSGERSAAGRIGEIWVSGPSVAAAYWGRPRASAEALGARLAGEPGSGPFLRTGDLGFLERGQLFVTGRQKDLIVVRGRNHYPQDIEATVARSHPELRANGGAAFAVDSGGEERLVVAQEVARRAKTDLAAIAAAVLRAVADEHELSADEVVLLQAGTIPKTSSGKIRRHACHDAYQRGTLDVLYHLRRKDPAAAAARCAAAAVAPPELPAAPSPDPISALEGLLLADVARAARLPVSAIDVTRTLTALGLDSLASVELQQALEERLGFAVPLAAILAAPSLRALAADLSPAVPDQLASDGPRPAAAAGTEHPLSHGQEALWFLNRLAPESAAYNIAAAACLRPAPDAAALRRALAALVARHPSLRTTFHAPGGTPLQRIHDQAEIAFRVVDATASSAAVTARHLREEAYRPFALESGPLLRVTLLLRPRGEAWILLVVHHLVADFWSLAVVARELGQLYAQESGAAPAPLAALPLRYGDYVRWQRDRLAGGLGERLFAYWREQLAGGLPVLELPADRPRAAVETHRGAAVGLRLGAAATAAARSLAGASESTLFMVLLAAFQALLHRHTGQRDLIVGAPTAGRASARLTGLVGYFVNPVALRSRLLDDPGFAAFLARTRATVLGAFAHQDLPFPLLAERLQPARDPSRSPVFQAMLVLQRAPRPEEEGLAAFAVMQPGVRISLGGLALESLPLAEETSQFDLTLRLAEIADSLIVSLQYSSDLFDAVTMRRLGEHFRILLQAAAADPERRLSELPLLSAAERQQLAIEWARGVPLPRLGPLPELLAEQARRRPDALAVECAGLRLGYGELERRSNQLAHRLRRHGIGPGARVGLALAPSLELVVGLLGILKAGAAYVPLDPAYPPERLALMIADAGIALLLTTEALLPGLPQARPSVLCLDRDGDGDGDITAAAAAAAPPPCAASPDDLLYVIYTSGSTGQPKGAGVYQGAFLDLLGWYVSEFAMSGADRFLVVSSPSFDLTQKNFFAPLLLGGELHLAPAYEPAALVATIAERAITRLNCTPSALYPLLDAASLPRLAALRTVFLGGEPIARARLAPWWRSGHCRAAVVNTYGPTECTDVVAFHRLEPAAPEERPAAIGRPVPGARLWVLGGDLALVPQGVPGQLAVGGGCVGMGYVGDPARTAAAFRPDPFAAPPGARLYLTGDLARWGPAGELDYLGRQDRQVKVRGFRVEPAEIEAVLERHPQVREVAVLARPGSAGDRQLVAYVVARQGGAAPSLRALRQHAAQSLPGYMLPVAAVSLPALPLSPHGKVDRLALERLAPPVLAGQDEEGRERPRTPVEELVAGIWSQVLGVDGPIGRGQSFFDLGGHSLLATQVVSRLRQVLGVELALRRLFELPTLADLASAVEAARAAPAPAPVPPLVPRRRSVAGEPEPAPLSFAQQRLWFLDQLDPGSATYNVPAALRLSGTLNVPALTCALDEVVRRHEVLRTVYAVVGGDPVQRIVPRLAMALPQVDLRRLTAPRRHTAADRLATAAARRPFDLAAGPLLRCILLRLAETEHLALLTMHHIVSDGWS